MTSQQPNRRTDDARIAVIETELRQIREGQKDHQRQDDKVFGTIFKVMAENQKAVMARIEELDLTMQKLWDERNQRTGAIKFSGIGAHIAAHALTAFISIAGFFGIRVLFK